MLTKVQKVLIIQDASKELSTTAVRWVLHGLSLKPEDKMTLLGIIQPLKSVASTSSTTGCGLLKRYKRKLDSSSTLKRKQELVSREIEKKLDEYHNNAEIKEILKLYEMQQIEFQVTVEAGHSLKDITVQAARNLGATCVILDRQMKKNQKYIMANLSCAILRLKHDNSIERLTEDDYINRTQEETCDKPETSAIGERQEEMFKRSICSVCKNRRPNIGFFTEFTYTELIVATNSFSPQNLMSKDGKEIYKGRLPNGMQIAVEEHAFFYNMIRNDTLKGISKKEFKSEVQVVGKARHENIAMLLGSCSEDGHRLLVYEYVCNGSLDQYLSKKKELTWETRLKIATGAAKGLQYLHRNNIYGYVRPNNILITHDHRPLLANFGLTRNQYEESDHKSGGRVKKTFEYIAPEYEETGKDSSKSDVYSFGVVLLELITGRRTIEDTKGQSFLRWARPLLKEKMYGDLIDPTMLEAHDLHQLVWMVRVVEKCLNWDPDRRFSIDKVVSALTCITQGRDIRDFSPPEYL